MHFADAINPELAAELSKRGPEIAKILGDNAGPLIQAVLDVAKFGQQALIDFIKKSPLPPEVKTILLQIVGDVQVIAKPVAVVDHDKDYIVGGLIGLTVGIALGTLLL
jgi:hypothetical protein